MSGLRASGSNGRERGLSIASAFEEPRRLRGPCRASARSQKPAAPAETHAAAPHLQCRTTASYDS